MCDDINAQIARVQLRPGDTLVLTTERMLNKEQRAAITEALESKFPDVPVLVVPADFRFSVIERTWLCGQTEALSKQSPGAVPLKVAPSWTFDGWMAERVAKAHAELMAGPAYRGPGCRAG